MLFILNIKMLLEFSVAAFKQKSQICKRNCLAFFMWPCPVRISMENIPWPAQAFYLDQFFASLFHATLALSPHIHTWLTILTFCWKI